MDLHAEELCDRIAIINHGKIIVDEDKRSLLSRVDGKEIEIRVAGPVNAFPPELSDLSITAKAPDTFIVKYDPKKTAAGQIISRIQSSGLLITDLSTKDQDLEDVFIRLTSSNPQKAQVA